MTEIERATNLIQRIERLFERATPPPWIYCEVDPTCPDDRSIRQDDGKGTGWVVIRDECVRGPRTIDWKSDRGDAENFSLIVTLRNVGLKGIVGPIRHHMSMYSACCLVNQEVAGLCDKCEQHILAIGEWCDVWEPELDREEGRK